MPALLILCLAFDLAAIKLEPNLERRSELALGNASAAMDVARDAASDEAKRKAALEELRDSVDLAYQSLVDSGKSARRNPKFFKRAELKTRELVRRLEGLAQAVDADDRVFVESVRGRVSKVHDDLIQDIMQKK
jgi:predicted dinucleotide-utilizing enzyme